MSKERLLQSVQRLATALARLERQTAADSSVSVSQLRLMLCLNHESPGKGVRVSDLAQDQGLAVSTMTRNIDLLERRGWITRSSGPSDRRTVVVELTETGRERAGELSHTTLGQFGRAFNAFHPSDRVERAVALDRVAAALEKVAPA